MRRIISLLCVLLATLLAACGKPPTSSDVIGTWVNPDGATLVLEKDGQFSARALPQKIFWWPDPGPPLEGKGTWKLKKGQAYWEVKLGFDEISGRPASREITVLISGSGASTYLFKWEDEEGGNRYELHKRKSP